MNLAYNPAAAFQVSITIPDWRGGISYRPNVIGPVMTPKDQRNQDNWLNPNNVVVPTDPSQPFGNAGRNIARRPGLAQMDFGLQKTFSLARESMNLEFPHGSLQPLQPDELRQSGDQPVGGGFWLDPLHVPGPADSVRATVGVLASLKPLPRGRGSVTI